MDTIRLKNIWSKIRASFWFIPTILAIASVALSIGIVGLDERVQLRADQSQLLFSGSPSGARAILSTIAGSMVGVAGVVFSITVVALSLASSQLGPRLLRNFMRDRTNQFVLGTFLATFLYCLLSLRAVNELNEERIPELTVAFAFVLALLSLAVLIYFIHHISTSIQADTVIAAVFKELEESIDHIFPDNVGEDGAEPPREPWPGSVTGVVIVRSTSSGYLQAISDERLMNLARDGNLRIRIMVRPGQFVMEDCPFAVVGPADRVGDEAAKSVEEAFILGRRRTAEQDVEFLIDQLVEIGGRALSPGINDPFTAIACVDHLGAALRHLSRRRMPLPSRFDEEGELRVVAQSFTYEGMVDAAFNQLRQHAKSSVPVTIRLLEAMELVTESNRGSASRTKHLLEHAERVHRGSLAAKHDPDDQRDIDERYHRVLKAAGTLLGEAA